MAKFLEPELSGGISTIRAAILCGLVLTLQAQPTGEDLLAHVRLKVRENVARLVNYVCTETVERRLFLMGVGVSPHSCDGLLEADVVRRLRSSDRLRLDVGSPEPGREMFSWAGEQRFEARTPGDLIQGENDRASFVGYLNMIFAQDPVVFSYRGELLEGGRELAEYVFSNSRETSHFGFWEDYPRGPVFVTAYEGAFLVDPRTFDLVRLTIRGVGVPRSAYACAVAVTLDYHNVPLNDATLLLPAASRLVFVDRDQTEGVAVMQFSNCHEFVGKSEVHFGVRTDAGRDAGPAKLDIRKRQPFEVAFANDIDTRTTAAGDTIRCQLLTPIRDGKKLIAPAGTPITARILELTTAYQRRRSVTLAFRLESLDLGGTVLPLSAHAKPSIRLRWTATGSKLTTVFGDLRGDWIPTSGLRTAWFTGP